MARPRILDAGIVLLIAGLPLLGAAMAGKDLRRLFHFPPPVDIPRDHATFSWLAAAAVLACIAAVLMPWIAAGRRAPQTTGASPTAVRSALARFPVWGWTALAWTGAWWTMAWTRWDWFAPLQPYTFFPLWLGFIVGVNALAERTSGSCLMRRAPGRWLALFAASAVCWWGFEWLNRFVLNWHYLGAERFGPVSYALHATLCFSTVLPAVAAVAEWIGAHSWWRRRTGAGPQWRWLDQRGTGIALFAAGALGLVATGIWPRWCYPALWVAPLALLLSVPVLMGRAGLAREMAAGDWRRAATWMLAALVCGWFWEMWNWRSDPKWIYTVPGVQRWHVFEMPLLGFAGYLPFGLECLLVTEKTVGRVHASGG